MKVTLKDETMEEGRELHVKGLSTPLVNGKTVELSKEEIAAFEERRGLKLAEAFENNPTIELAGSGSKGGDV